MSVYNGSPFVAEAVASVLAQTAGDLELIVVDDGSTDRTAEVVGRFRRARLIRHPTNQGKGRSVRTGLSHANGDVILIQDADLEYPPSNYPDLLAPIVRGDARPATRCFIETSYGNSRFGRRALSSARS
jgi:glycosyltransferase involved in cell wall biosynthesis